MNDIITKVNDTPVVGVPHSTAVDALKRAGHRVTLCVKRKKNFLPLGPNIMEIELSKGTKVIIIEIIFTIDTFHILISYKYQVLYIIKELHFSFDAKLCELVNIFKSNLSFHLFNMSFIFHNYSSVTITTIPVTYKY